MHHLYSCTPKKCTTCSDNYKTIINYTPCICISPINKTWPLQRELHQQTRWPQWKQHPPPEYYTVNSTEDIEASCRDPPTHVTTSTPAKINTHERNAPKRHLPSSTQKRRKHRQINASAKRCMHPVGHQYGDPQRKNANSTDTKIHNYSLSTKSNLLKD